MLKSRLHIIDTLDEFYKISGYRNNAKKTAIIGLGNKKGKQTEIHGLKLTTQMTILGLEIQADLDKTKNFRILNNQDLEKRILNNTRILEPTCIKTWEQEQKNNIKQYINWDNQYKALKKLYLEPKLKSFQYLVMNRRITTKKE